MRRRSIRMYSPTIYKFKDKLDISNAELEKQLREELEEDGRVNVKKGRINSQYSFTLFLIKSKGKPHAWLEFINTLCKIPNPTINYLNFILIIFSKANPRYCIFLRMHLIPLFSSDDSNILLV